MSRVLQTVNQDLGEAVELADAAKEVLMARRENATETFKKIFETVVTVCAEHDIELKTPRLARKQTQRCNVMAERAEDYFRIGIYIPYLDLFVTHLQDRFLKHRHILSNFACLFPKKVPNFDRLSCFKLFETFESVLHDKFPEAWISEVEIWRKRIENVNIQNSLEALDICRPEAFPNVNKMLRIMAVLPVTTSGNERSFSTLRRLKTYLRSTMKENRLNGLAALNIHRNIHVNVESVLKEFFLVPRRIALLKEK